MRKIETAIWNIQKGARYTATWSLLDGPKIATTDLGYGNLEFEGGEINGLLEALCDECARLYRQVKAGKKRYPRHPTCNYTGLFLKDLRNGASFDLVEDDIHGWVLIHDGRSDEVEGWEAIPLNRYPDIVCGIFAELIAFYSKAHSNAER